MDAIGSFFSWLAKGPGTWSLPKDDFDEEKLLELHNQLAEAFPELTPTVSWTPDAPFEIQFSAKLRPSAAPLIRKIVGAAPKLKNWKFVAFQPPIGFYPLYVGHLGLPFKQLASGEVRVDVVSEARPWELRVFVPRYTSTKGHAFDTAVRLLLEAGMGEAWLLEDVGKLELLDMKHVSKTAKSIDHLPKLLSAKTTGRKASVVARSMKLGQKKRVENPPKKPSSGKALRAKRVAGPRKTPTKPARQK